MSIVLGPCKMLFMM